MTASSTLTKPVRAFGGFIGMSLDTLVVIFRPPLAWREYLLQTWFVARVSVLPALMLTLPYSVLLVFTFNILLVKSERRTSPEPERPSARSIRSGRL